MAFDRSSGLDRAMRSSSCPESIILGVSPLITLMKEQVLIMEKRGITSLYSGDMDENSRRISAYIHESRKLVKFCLLAGLN